MRRFAITATAVLVVFLVIVPLVLLRVVREKIGSSMNPLPSSDAAYPRAPSMPATVAEPVEQLLARYERILQDQAPAVLAALQPGLSDAEIDALEATHQFQLTADLRALYRWRNGTSRLASINAFPDHQFVPLDEALAMRDKLRRDVKASTPAQQQAYATFAGHRDAWLDVIVDPAGDGYFFDPGRSETQGSFFYCFGEDGSYEFFPAFRNYLAAVIEGYETGIFEFDIHGSRTKDYKLAQELMSKYSAVPRR